MQQALCSTTMQNVNSDTGLKIRAFSIRHRPCCQIAVKYHFSLRCRSPRSCKHINMRADSRQLQHYTGPNTRECSNQSYFYYRSYQKVESFNFFVCLLLCFFCCCFFCRNRSFLSFCEDKTCERVRRFYCFSDKVQQIIPAK